MRGSEASGWKAEELTNGGRVAGRGRPRHDLILRSTYEGLDRAGGRRQAGGRSESSNGGRVAGRGRPPPRSNPAFNL